MNEIKSNRKKEGNRGEVWSLHCIAWIVCQPTHVFDSGHSFRVVRKNVVESSMNRGCCTGTFFTVGILFFSSIEMIRHLHVPP